MRKVNKKGKNAFVLLFYTFFSLMLAAFFIIAVLSKVNAAVSDSLFYKKFYSRDLALLVDSLHATNGDFAVDYYLAPEGVFIDVNLTSDRVIASDTSNIPLEQRAQSVFLFGTNQYITIIPTGYNSYTLTFEVAYEDGSITFKNPSKFMMLEGGGGGSGGGGGGAG